MRKQIPDPTSKRSEHHAEGSNVDPELEFAHAHEQIQAHSQSS